MVPNACYGLKVCKILHPGLILLLPGATHLYGEMREGLNFLGARGPCVQGDVSACAAWQLGHPLAPSLAVLASLFPVCLLLKLTVSLVNLPQSSLQRARWLISALTITCCRLTGEQASAEVTARMGSEH